MTGPQTYDFPPGDEAHEPHAGSPSHPQPPEPSNDDLQLARAFAQAYNSMPGSKQDPAVVQETIASILRFDYPSELRNAPLAERLAYWMTESKVPLEQLEVAGKLQRFLAKPSALRKGEDIVDANQVLSEQMQPHHGAISDVTNLAANGVKLAAAPLGILGSLLSRWGAQRKERNLMTRMDQATEKAYSAMVDHQKGIDSGIEALAQKVETIASMPRGSARDTAVDELRKLTEDVGKKIKDSAESQSRLSADPACDSRFRRKPQEIEQEAQENDGRVQAELEKAHVALDGDQPNQNKVAETMAKMRELMDRLQEMIANIFNGFRRQNRAGGPAPS